MLRKLLLLSAAPTSVDLGLLVLRLSSGIPLFLKHGTEKILHFHQMAGHFPDPIHIGAAPSLVVALVSDAICSVLLVLGLATRWAAAVIFCNIAVAWAFVHHFAFFSRPTGDHGELIVLYLGGVLAIFIAGPGRFSVDSAISTRGA